MNGSAKGIAPAMDAHGNGMRKRIGFDLGKMMKSP